jgi:peptide deformylase
MALAIARIRRFGHRCLRRRARSVPPAHVETRSLLDTLWATLDAEGGVGLAAPQIGRDCRVVVVRDIERPRGRQRLELVNPVIMETFGPDIPFEEGCLSFPGLYTQVWRPRGIVVAFDEPSGRRELREEGLAARIIQHEVDHLDGILFIDHLSTWQRFLLLPRLMSYATTELWRNWFGKERTG